MESKDERKSALIAWVRDYFAHQFTHQQINIQMMMPDASFRRYFRVHTPTGSFVAMDAPVAVEDCRPYVAVAAALREQGLNAPIIFHQDLAQGFLLISDFGGATYLNTLNAQNVDHLYGQALAALSVLQGCRHVPGHALSFFDDAFMWQEWVNHKIWFAEKYLALPSHTLSSALDDCMHSVIQRAVNQPQVFIHRDYHSANLMVLPETSGVGLLDFQDALMGPVTYDLVSLLRDCYIDWSEAQVLAWVGQYHQQLKRQGVLSHVTLAEFHAWFDWMGVQRHLKALFIFARKAVRDHNPRYLNYVPRTLNYLKSVSEKYAALAPLNHYLTQAVAPALQARDVCVP